MPHAACASFAWLTASLLIGAFCGEPRGPPSGGQLLDVTWSYDLRSSLNSRTGEKGEKSWDGLFFLYLWGVPISDHHVSRVFAIIDAELE